jgi:hypothetical protein
MKDSSPPLHRSTGVSLAHRTCRGARSRAPACIPLFFLGRSISSLALALALHCACVVFPCWHCGWAWARVHIWAGDTIHELRVDRPLPCHREQAGQGPPLPLPWQLDGRKGRQRAKLHTHAQRTTTATPPTCCSYECRSTYRTGLSFPSGVGRPTGPDAPLCLWPFAYGLLWLTRRPVSGSISSSNSGLWYDAWSAVVVNTALRQGSGVVWSWHECMRVRSDRVHCTGSAAAGCCGLRLQPTAVLTYWVFQSFGLDLCSAVAKCSRWGRSSEPNHCWRNPQNSTCLRQCSGNSTPFQVIQKTALILSNEFRIQYSIYIFFILLFLTLQTNGPNCPYHFITLFFYLSFHNNIDAYKYMSSIFILLIKRNIQIKSDVL